MSPRATRATTRPQSPEPRPEPSSETNGTDRRPTHNPLPRHAMGAATARRLLLTVMGEFVLPTGGVAWTSTFIEVLGRFDIDPGTTRQALARTMSAGWLGSERGGRRTRWHPTPAREEP